MELHTLGVGGVPQDDVRHWRASSPAGPLLDGKDNSRARQLRLQRQCAPAGRAAGCSAKIYQDSGVAQGEAALADIARHHSTRNSSQPNRAPFVADDPPPALVAAAAGLFPNPTADLEP